MKIAASILALICLSPFVCKEPAVAESIEEFHRLYRWEKRVFIISAPDPDDQRVHAMLDRFAAFQAEVAERHMVILQISEKKEGYLREAYSIRSDRFQLLLIGKDGTVKLRSDDIVPPDTIFSLIDSMPMRRQEVGKKVVSVSK